MSNACIYSHQSHFSHIHFKEAYEGIKGYKGLLSNIKTNITVVVIDHFTRSHGMLIRYITSLLGIDHLLEKCYYLAYTLPQVYETTFINALG